MFLTMVRRIAVLSILLSAIGYLTVKPYLNSVANRPTQEEINLNPVAEPPDPSLLRPVERVPRDRFGVVGEFPLSEDDLRALVYPSANDEERAAVIEGLNFFTTPHTPEEGNGPIANQQMCLGCHLNSAEAFRFDRNGNRLVTTSSQVSRAARTTPTNFSFTAFDPATGGGRAPDNNDAINNTGKTAAFTIFGDFSPSAGVFDGLTQFSSNSVQHHRPTLDPCVPTSLPSFAEDPNLVGGVDPETNLSSTGFRRTVGERAGPPYIGRGLIEAVFDGEILANEAAQTRANHSSLDRPGAFRECPGRMPRGGDQRDPNAINQSDRMLNCAGCHIPVMATGRLPVESGGRHVNNKWAPLFSDLLIHKGPDVTAERIAPTPRLPLVIKRAGADGLYNTFDLPRGLSDDTLPNQGVATGREFRTAPLMGLGRIGPPFLHDGRIFLSKLSSKSYPAGTVYSNKHVTNAPLVIQTLDDAIQAAIELHDLPAPFDSPNQSSRVGGGCPVPPGNQQGDVIYRGGAAEICPRYGSDGSKENRGEAREVIRRFRSLSANDQKAVIEFLKQL